MITHDRVFRTQPNISMEVLRKQLTAFNVLDVRMGSKYTSALWFKRNKTLWWTYEFPKMPSFLLIGVHSMQD